MNLKARDPARRRAKTQQKTMSTAYLQAHTTVKCATVQGCHSLCSQIIFGRLWWLNSPLEGGLVTKVGCHEL